MEDGAGAKGGGIVESDAFWRLVCEGLVIVEFFGTEVVTIAWGFG